MNMNNELISAYELLCPQNHFCEVAHLSVDLWIVVWTVFYIAYIYMLYKAKLEFNGKVISSIFGRALLSLAHAGIHTLIICLPLLIILHFVFGIS